MSKHTPGPWKMTRRDGSLHGDSDNLGWDWDMENAPPEPMRGMFSKEADAMLVCAAPDLLEALKWFYSPYDGYSVAELERRWLMGFIDTPTLKCLMAARAAIAKATQP